MELDVWSWTGLDRDGTLSSIDISSREDFFGALRFPVPDVETPRGRGDYVLAPAVLQKILSEVSDGERQSCYA